MIFFNALTVLIIPLLWAFYGLITLDYIIVGNGFVTLCGAF